MTAMDDKVLVNLDEILLCGQCGRELEMQNVKFSYLGQHFQTELPSCPDCGQPYIPEDLVRGRINEVETELEDK